MLSSSFYAPSSEERPALYATARVVDELAPFVPDLAARALNHGRELREAIHEARVHYRLAQGLGRLCYFLVVFVALRDGPPRPA